MTDLEKKLTEECEKLREENRVLRAKVDYILRQLYGSKSEKLNPDQLELLLDPDAAKKEAAAGGSEEPPAADDDGEDEKVARKPRQSRLRRSMEHLPVVEKTVVPEEVEADPESYRSIRCERSEKLHVTPAIYWREVTVRPVYVKKDEIQASPFVAPLQPCLLENSVLTPSLLASVLTEKFCYHMPFDRQSVRMKRCAGLDVSRNLLCHWAKTGALWLEPLYNLIAWDILWAPWKQIDETPAGYQQPGHGKLKKGYFWVYFNPEAGVLYDWHTSRASGCLDNILGRQKDIPHGCVVQTDGYEGYKKWVSAQNGRVTAAGCWAHTRRKFEEAKNEGWLAARILQLIQKLYRIERAAKTAVESGAHPPWERSHYRRRHALPVINEIRELLELNKRKHTPKSGLGKAISYALGQWDKLVVYIDHGELEIDTNLVENAIRPLKLGAKNWMFIGHSGTGQQSAVIYTMIENVRRLGHDPYAWLEWVFTKLPAMTNQDDLRQLLPANWAASQKVADAGNEATAAVA